MRASGGRGRRATARWRRRWAGARRTRTAPAARTTPRGCRSRAAACRGPTRAAGYRPRRRRSAPAPRTAPHLDADAHPRPTARSAAASRPESQAPAARPAREGSSLGCGMRVPSFREAVAEQRPHRDHAVLPRDFLAFFPLAAIIRDRHLVDAMPALEHLGGDLRLEVKPFGAQRDVAHNLRAEDLVA